MPRAGFHYNLGTSRRPDKIGSRAGHGPRAVSCTWLLYTVVPVMNGHPRGQAKVSVHCRWPLVTGTDGQAGDAKYNTPCNTT